jgi:hypothetical protein
MDSTASEFRAEMEKLSTRVEEALSQDREIVSLEE